MDFMFPNDHKNTNNNEELYEDIISLSYNNGQKVATLFQIRLYKNRLEINRENSRDLSTISCIYYNYIVLAKYNSSSESFQMTLSPQCRLFLSNDLMEYINHLTLYDILKKGPNNFKTILFKYLVPEKYSFSTDQTTFFIFTDIQINKEPWSKSKCHLSKHELFMSFPIDLDFDLSTTEQLALSNDKLCLQITLPNYDLRIKLYDNGQLIFNIFEDATKIRLLSLQNPTTVTKLDELIKFIGAYGLKSEGVFRLCGTMQKIESLFCLVLERQGNLKINPDEFTVNDVTSFLKKCFQTYLSKPLISETVFGELRVALEVPDADSSKIALKKCLELLPEPNLKILRHICELLFMITEMNEFNKMNSENLAIATAVSFISSKLESLQQSSAILRAFIDDFVIIFDYSDEERRRMKIITENMRRPSQFSVRRQFLVGETMQSVIRTSLDVSSTKIDKKDAYVLCSVCVDQCGTIKDVFSNVFLESWVSNVDLWHFITVKKRWFKRLLYVNDLIDDTILNGWNYPVDIDSGKAENHFIFRGKSEDRDMKLIAKDYRCIVTIKNSQDEASKVIVELMPKLLEGFDERTGNSVFRIQLINLKLYRIHNSDCLLIYSINEDRKVLKWTFKTRNDYKEFLSYFDKFRFEHYP